MARGDRWPVGSFIAELPDSERGVLLAAGDPCRFDDEQALLLQGDPGDFVYVLTSGLVKVMVATETGAATMVAIRSRGDLVGEFAPLDEQPRVATARAIGLVTALRVSGRAFTEITGRSPAARAAVTRYLLAKVRSVTELRAADRAWEARERVAQVLFELGERHAVPGADGMIRLPITQGELGELAGVAVSTAERVLKGLRKQGLISTRYREITIRDLAHLGSIRFTENPENPEKPLHAGICCALIRYVRHERFRCRPALENRGAMENQRGSAELRAAGQEW